jgi:hypothetical protein
MSQKKATATTKVKGVKKKPVKAGSQNKGGDGGIFTDKVIKIKLKAKASKSNG